MVFAKTRKRKTLRRKRRTIRVLIMIGMVILVGLVVFFILNGNLRAGQSNGGSEDVAKESAYEFAETDDIPIKQYDFQSVVDNFADTTRGDIGVIIYDLDLGKLVGSYNHDSSFSTASLYKLFVVYEGYLRVQSGEWDGDAPAGVTQHTILECLDLSIRESNSECAETLWPMIGRETLDSIVKTKFKANQTSLSDLISTPDDIMTIMRLFYLHSGISDEKLLSQMKDSFLNQPKTMYDWRQGLPSGFTNPQTTVYNKVGWDYNAEGGYWNIYNDAAIVDFADNDRHFIVVVMTSGASFQNISKLGSAIEEYYYNN